MKVDLLTFIKLIAKSFAKLILYIFRSQLIRTLIRKYHAMINHPNFWGVILLVCVLICLSLLKNFINNLSIRRQKRILK